MKQIKLSLVIIFSACLLFGCSNNNSTQASKTDTSNDVSFNIQLTKVEHRDIPVSMFEIPSGYTEDKSGL